jgi:hypothetical protein
VRLACHQCHFPESNLRFQNRVPQPSLGKISKVVGTITRTTLHTVGEEQMRCIFLDISDIAFLANDLPASSPGNVSGHLIFLSFSPHSYDVFQASLQNFPGPRTLLTPMGRASVSWKTPTAMTTLPRPQALQNVGRLSVFILSLSVPFISLPSLWPDSSFSTVPFHTAKVV